MSETLAYEKAKPHRAGERRKQWAFLFAAIPLLVPVAIAEAWAFGWLWLWFVTPILGVHALSDARAIRDALAAPTHPETGQ